MCKLCNVIITMTPLQATIWTHLHFAMWPRPHITCKNVGNCNFGFGCHDHATTQSTMAEETGTKRAAEDVAAPEAKRVHVDSEESAMNASESDRKDRGYDRKGGRGGKGGRGAKRKFDGRERNKQAGKARGGRAWDDAKPKVPKDEEAVANATPVPREDGEKRLPKKRAAVLVGYCGTGYSGMQMYVHL